MFDKFFSAWGNWWRNQAEPAKPHRTGLSGQADASVREDAGLPVAPLEIEDSSPSAEIPAGQAEPVLVHGEVLDETLAVRGVEFFVRGELYANLDLHREANRRFLDGMLLDQLASLRGNFPARRQPWVRLAETSLMRLGIGRLPARAAVLLTSEKTQRPAHGEMAETIAALQEAGHEVWLDDAIGTPWFASLAGLANGATLRLATRTPGEVTALLQRAHEDQPRLRLGAWGVATLDDFNFARTLHCTRFTGSFVTRREDWRGNELSPQMLSVASLINQIREETNFRAVAQVLRQDMAMSYRLLRYVNSAAQGLAQPISSIEQGLLILGQTQLDRWLTLLLLSGGVMGDTALTEIALTRARFLELAGAGRLPPEQCEKLFVLGLFSMLDVALKVPLEVALKPLRLAEALNAALLRREGPLGRYLALADACARGAASEVIRNALMLGLTTRKVSAYQIEALNWVATIAAEPVRGGGA